MSWFPPHSWRTFLLNVGFWADTAFLSALKKHATSLWTPWFLMKNPLPFQLFFPYRKDVISLSLVSRPCFCLVFRSLTVMCLGADFFEFSYLEFTQLLESVGLYILPNLRLFQLSFLCILLKSYLLSPFFETLMTGVLDIFYYSPSSPWDAIQFYFVCFLSVVVIFQSSSSLVFPYYSFHFAIEYISQVLKFLLLHFSILF